MPNIAKPSEAVLRAESLIVRMTSPSQFDSMLRLFDRANVHAVFEFLNSSRLNADHNMELYFYRGIVNNIILPGKRGGYDEIDLLLTSDKDSIDQFSFRDLGFMSSVDLRGQTICL